MDELRRQVHRIDARSPEQTILDNIQDLADTAVRELPVTDAMRILKTADSIFRAAINELEEAAE